MCLSGQYLLRTEMGESGMFASQKKVTLLLNITSINDVLKRSVDEKSRTAITFMRGNEKNEPQPFPLVKIRVNRHMITLKSLP